METRPTGRRGTAFWLSDFDAPLARAVAAAEDRPLTNVISRALKLYAAQSMEYQRHLKAEKQVQRPAAPKKATPKKAVARKRRPPQQYEAAD